MGQAQAAEQRLEAGTRPVLVLAPIAGDISSGAAIGSGSGLGTVFDVTQNPGQLLLAAVFGLSPQLLFDRLGASADQYQAQLSSTQVSASVPQTSDAVGDAQG